MNYKNKANITLICMFVAFILTAILKYFYGHGFLIDFLFAVVEASLVGGTADWFAITALFKKPLFISFHTAIIPRNRVKIIDGITSAVEEQLLSKDIISEKISELNLSRGAVNLIEKNKVNILDYIEQEINKYIIEKGKEKLLNLSKKLKNDYIKKRSLTDVINVLTKNIYNSNNDEKIIDFIIDEVIEECKNEKLKLFIYKILMDLKKEKLDNFLAKISFGFLEKTDSVNLEDASENFCNQLIKELYNMKHKENKYREKIKKELFQMFLKIEYNRENIEDEKIKFIDTLDISSLIDDITNKKNYDGRETSILASYIRKQIDVYLDKLVRNEEFNSHMDKTLKYALVKFMNRNHNFIGSIVKQTLDQYDDKKLNEFIEDKFGEDLQWIRINGSVVGGIIGAGMFLFLRLLYDPFVVPVIRKLVL
jgi:uncharacterized membrane-anchored protein YjiN (DUF445 family)